MGNSKNMLIGVAVAVGIIAVLVIANAGSEPTSVASSQSAGTAEGGYIGRLLPAGYEAPSVGGTALYTEAVFMTDIAAVQEDSGVSVSVSEVTDKKIVRWEYQRADGQRLPMLAYVRPSGDLFIGVNYCPPCEGEGQRIESDGTLTCESCGTKRVLESNEGISGACKLYPLDEVPSVVDGDRIEVDGTVLDSWTPQPLDRPVG